MKRLFSIFYEEFVHVFHDKGVLIFVIFVPLAYPLLYSYVYTNEVVRNVPVVVVDHANSKLSREFVRRLDATPEVKILTHAGSMAETKRYLQSRKAYGAIEIPETFDRDLYVGDQTVVALYSDMSSMLYYKALLLAATDVSLYMNRNIKVEHHLHATTRRDSELAETPVEYDHISLFNPQSGFASFLIPPVLMLIIQQTLLLGVGMQMGDTRERYFGFMVPFNRNYKNPMLVVIGKALVYLAIYLVMYVYMITFVTQQFALPSLGSFGPLMRFGTLFILDCIFFAMALSSFIYRREDCILVFVFLSVPMLFLSGISWPGSGVPVFWKYFSCLFPSTFGINGYVKLMNMGGTIDDVHLEMTGLLIQACVYFAVSCLRYWREILTLRGRYYRLKLEKQSAQAS